jgi:hypothetical protein
VAEYVRLVRGQVQTSIRRYAHPDTGRQVMVVGTHHVGRPGYFGALRAVIDAAEAAGAVVHSEGSSRVPFDTADITAEERQLLAELERYQELGERRIRELGWVGQVEGLGYPPQWHIVDLSNVDIIRRLGGDTVREYIGRMSRMLGPHDDPRALDRMLLRIAVGTRLTMTDRHVVRLGRRDRAAAVLLGDRDKVALEGVRATDRDAVLVWGAGHMPGLGAGLVEQGFLRQGPPEWHTAVQVPSINRALWGLITGGSRAHRSISDEARKP